MEIVKLLLVLLPAALIVFSGLMKFSSSKKIVDTLGKAGVLPYKNYLGVAEIVFAILFIIPDTRTIGFLLLICYFSGALATDLSHRSPLVAPLVILLVLFVAAYVNGAPRFY